MWEKVAHERNIPWNTTVVFEIGFNETQHKTFEEYMKWGIQNGLQETDLELLDGNEIAKREPNVKSYSGIFCKKEVASHSGEFTKYIKKQSHTRIPQLGKRLINTHNSIRSLNQHNNWQLLRFREKQALSLTMMPYLANIAASFLRRLP